MQTTACQKLSELVSEFGVEICEDQRRLEALLKDVLSNEHRREIFLLVVSAREGIARQLMSQDSSIPAALLGSRLVQHLCDDLALEEASARWAVECWANALNVQNPFSSVPDCSSPRTRTESGIETVQNGRSRPQGNRNSSAAKESVEAFRTAVAAIESGYSTRSFLLSRDETELARWEHDADAGIPEAQWLMGDCYLEGIGGRLDDAIARQWFQAACDSGLAWGGITFGTI
jgi:hypothetical protein